MEWGKTWPIAHRQPGAVLPPPPLSPEQIHTMLVARACFQPKSSPCICFTNLLLSRQRNMLTLVAAVTSSGGSSGVAVVAPSTHPPATKSVDLDYTPPADGTSSALCLYSCLSQRRRGLYCMRDKRLQLAAHAKCNRFPALFGNAMLLNHRRPPPAPSPRPHGTSLPCSGSDVLAAW